MAGPVAGCRSHAGEFEPTAEAAAALSAQCPGWFGSPRGGSILGTFAGGPANLPSCKRELQTFAARKHVISSFVSHIFLWWAGFPDGSPCLCLCGGVAVQAKLRLNLGGCT